MLTLLAILLPGVAGLGLWFWAHQRWTKNEPAIIAVGGALVVLVLVLVGGYTWRGHQLQEAREDVRGQALAIDSLEAVADTVRVHELEDERGRRHVAETRAVQAELEADSVDAILGTERRARVRAEVRVARLEAQVDTDVAIDSIEPDVRLVDATVRTEPPSPPATVRIRGRVGPERAQVRVTMDLDPVDLVVGVHCGPANAAGIRPARVSLDTPEWLTVGKLEPQLDPATCNPPPDPPPTFLERLEIGAKWAVGGAVVGGLAVLIFVP